MAENIVEKNYKGKFVKIGIAEDSIEEIRLKNYTVSAIVPVAFVLVVGAVLIITAISIAVVSVIPYS